MNRTTLTGLALAAAFTIGGVFLGRSLADHADPTELGVVSLLAPPAGVEYETLPIIGHVSQGDAPPAPPSDDDPTLGLGPIVGSEEAVKLDPARLGEASAIPPAVIDDPALPPVAPPEGWRGAPPAPGDTEGAGAVPIDEALAEGGLIEPPGAPTDVSIDDSTGDTTTGDTTDDGTPGRHVDPCAPSGGEPSEACPEGVRSTVLGLASAPDLWFQGHRSTRGVSGGVWGSCPDSAAPTPEQLGLVFTANAPGTVTVWVQSALDPLEVASADVGATGADQSTWEATLPDVSEDDRYRLNIPYCVVIVEPPAGTQLTVTATIVDVFGRSRTFGFEVDTLTPRRPPTQVWPVSPNTVLVSVPHRADQFVDLRTRLIDGAEGDCSTAGTALYSSLRVEGDVSSTYLLRNNFDPVYTKRTWVLVAVPDSSTAIVCSRVFDTRVPSFDRSRPVLSESFVVTAPDLVLPVVTVESVSVNSAVVGRVSVGLNYVGGTNCGGAGYTAAAGAPATEDYNHACDPTTDMNWGAATALQNLRIDAGISRAASEWITTSAVVSTRGRRCLGGDVVAGVAATCPSLPTQHYRVPLGTVSVPAGMCSPGLFESSCEPPRRDLVAGEVVVRVEWTNTRSNGASTWSVRPSLRTGRDNTLPVFPQLDDSDVFGVTGGRYPVVSGTLTADRPVVWEVGVPPEGCLVAADSGAEIVSTVASGVPSTTFAVRLSGLCTGLAHQLYATITDPTTGATASFGRVDRPGARGWSGGHVWVPGYERPLTVVLSAAPVAAGTQAVAQMQLAIGRPGATHRETTDYAFPTPLSTEPRFLCYRENNLATGLNNSFTRDGFGIPVMLPDVVRVTVTVTMTPAAGSATNCRRTGGTTTVTFSADVSRESLSVGAGLRLSSPDGAAITVIALLRPG